MEEPAQDARRAGEPEPVAATRPTIDVILTRRSVRDGFGPGPLDPDELRQIVRCGLAAPSSKNARPWMLHVVTDRSVLAAIADAVEHADGADTYVPRDPATGIPRADWPSTVVESADVLRHAAVGIFVENRGTFSDGRRTLSATTGERLAGSLVGYTFEVLGIGGAVQNMWLAAHSLGIQGTYMGDVVIAEADISRRLGLQLDLVGVLALGHSEALPAADRRAYDVDDSDRVRWHRAGGPG